MTIEYIKNNNLLLFEVIAGSRSFGLSTASSDTDIRGVFYLPRQQFYSLGYISQVSNETNDVVYYEIGRFVELLLKNNPNILEMLATPDEFVLYRHPLMNMLKIEDFLSRLCKDSFAGYAATQIKKARGLKKKIINPMPADKKSLLDFCYIIRGQNSERIEQWLAENNFQQENCGLIPIPHMKNVYSLFYDKNESQNYKGIIQSDTSNDVSVSSVSKGDRETACLYVNIEGYSSYCKDYREYWDWIEKRNEDRYNTNLKHGKSYDSKNMMHTSRLLQSAQQIIQDGKLNTEVQNREELLNIKAGKVDYDDLLQMADNYLVKIEEASETSPLPNLPNKQNAEKVLVQIREKLYN